MRRFAMSALAGLAGAALLAGPAGAQRSQGGDRGSLSDTVSVIDQQRAPDSFSALARRLMPSVVNITTSQTVAPNGMPEFPDGSPLERFNEFFGRDPEGFRREGSLGSGFVVSADGVIITNKSLQIGFQDVPRYVSDPNLEQKSMPNSPMCSKMFENGKCMHQTSLA